MGDARLMVQFAAGDPVGVAELYRAYGRQVYALAHRVLGDAGLAQDATRQTFLHAHRLARDFDPGQELAPWLAAIAGRTAIDVHRRTQRRMSPPEPADPEPAGSEPDPDPDPDSDPDPDPDPPTTARGQEVWVVRHALDALSDQDRELIRLQHHRKLTQVEISEILDIPLDEVVTRSEQAHRRFAGLLRQQGRSGYRSRTV